MLYALKFEMDALLRILRQHRIIGAELLDEAAVARVARIGDDDAKLRALLGADASQADGESHFSSFRSIGFGSSFLLEVLRSAEAGQAAKAWKSARREPRKFRRQPRIGRHFFREFLH